MNSSIGHRDCQGRVLRYDRHKADMGIFDDRFTDAKRWCNGQRNIVSKGQWFIIILNIKQIINIYEIDKIV